MKRIQVYDGCGTIDAEPYVDQPTPDDITPLQTSVVPSVLKALQKPLWGEDRCDFHTWTRKDSKYITQEDKEQLVRMILDNPEELSIVHLGTDRSIEIGMFLREALKGTGKTVLLVSAMKPLMHGLVNLDASQNTDGFDHLNYALSHIDEVHAEQPGVYLVSRKEVARGRFETALMNPQEVVKDKSKLAFVDRIQPRETAERTFQ